VPRLRLATLAFAALCAPCAFAGESYPEPAPPADESGLGLGLQRTMTLLATSAPERRNKVRILFYGQSITVQAWWRMVADDLRKRFPNADLEIENRALGGFASQRLVRTAEYDLYPFCPDLLVFHVYGSHTDYEKIIENARKRTAAEILMQSDHLTQWPVEVKGSNPWQWPWDENMNRNLLPAIAKKYSVPFVPIRAWWLEYLKANHLEPKSLLSDGVHLNAHGEFLMGRLVSRYLKYRPEIPKDSWQDLAREYVLGKDVDWKDGKLALDFEGNRVDVLADQGPGGSAQVQIDGKKPSDFPELYYHARPSGTAGVGWPAIQRISWEKPLVLETWTATCRGFNEKQDQFEFAVEGSKTGPDGSGKGNLRFVSNSGRVVIEPKDWVFEYCKQVSKKPTPDGFKVTWQVKPLFVDTCEPPKVEDAAKEYPVTLASGLKNEKHTLILTATQGGKSPVKAIRVYQPSYK
jgi:hypothetical protein